MQIRAFNIFLFILSLSILSMNNVWAHEVGQMRESESLTKSTENNKKWSFEFLFEEENWDVMNSTEAHLLHEDGHDIHNKTTEQFYHFSLGRVITDNLSLTLNLPYVVRNSLNVGDGKVGLKDKSEGVGDLNASFTYRSFNDNNLALGIVGGVKFPTGVTSEKDVGGDKFEPELQPGSGSYDYLIGGIFEHQIDRTIVKGKATYSFKNEGGQNFEFGDIFSTSLFIDFILNPNSKNFKTKAGVDINYQFAQEDETKGVEDPDSGGHTIFVGPTITVDGSKNISIFGNILFPVMQDLGGVHQELDYVWTAGGKIEF